MDKREASSYSPIRINTVIVTYFEPEFDPWRSHLGASFPFAAAAHPLLFNATLGALAVCTGMGPRRASAVVTALGLDRRFELRGALWLSSGVAGIDPEVGSLGDALWARRVIDGSVGYFVDRAEDSFPSAWARLNFTGLIPLTCSHPFCATGASDAEIGAEGLVFELDNSLTTWAVMLTAQTQLPDSATLASGRMPFGQLYPEAARPPKVHAADTLSSQPVWVGAAAARWARAWVRYWGGPEARLGTTAMEDSAVVLAISLLDRLGVADSRRVLSLRAAANFCLQPPGEPISKLAIAFAATSQARMCWCMYVHFSSRAKAHTRGHSLLQAKGLGGRLWQPGRDPVTGAAAANAVAVALQVVHAVARGETPQPLPR
mmetsp:Transcript_44071/g.103093  ORF Transcript_44071/g.103093 Transcript_44071/m.103093 type:complete len:375 (-) Transcript_44071:340-1464(-)